MGGTLCSRKDGFGAGSELADRIGDAFKSCAGLVYDVLASLDIFGAFLHALDCLHGVRLDGGDEGCNLLCCLSGFFSEFSHFFGDDREAAACFASACCLDGSIECEQVGLIGDIGNGIADLTDFHGAFCKFFDDSSRFRNRIGDLIHLGNRTCNRGLSLCGNILYAMSGGGGSRGTVLKTADVFGHCPDIVGRSTDGSSLLAC